MFFLPRRSLLRSYDWFTFRYILFVYVRCYGVHCKRVDVILPPRYPKVMADEGVRVVREWLGASNTIAEGRHVGVSLVVSVA